MGIAARGLYSTASDAEDPAYVKGNWYVMNYGTLAAGAIIPASTLRLIPFRIRQMVNIAQLGGRITTLAASGNIQFGVYAANGNTLLPTGGPLIRTGNIATDIAGPVAAVPVSGTVQLSRGIYWFGVMADAAAAGVVIMQTLSTVSAEPATMIGSPVQATISSGPVTNNFHRVASSITYGTWPDLTGITTTEATGTASAGGQFLVAS